jgi:predicted nucleic acid-binding protein
MRAEDPDLQERRQVGDLPKATLIDTSAWILALRKEVSSRAIYEVDRRIEGNRAATAGIITLELLSGRSLKRIWKRSSNLKLHMKRGSELLT